MLAAYSVGTPALLNRISNYLPVCVAIAEFHVIVFFLRQIASRYNNDRSIVEHYSRMNASISFRKLCGTASVPVAAWAVASWQSAERKRAHTKNFAITA
jgi:ABC-type transport system involved in cytochrome c biogenesis permease subunit